MLYDAIPQISVDDREFLAKPFEQIEFRRLKDEPTIDFLQWCATLPDEVGVAYDDHTWLLIKASELGIPTWAVPKNSRTFIHSHYDWQGKDGRLPSTRDIYNAVSNRTNLIASTIGMTRFEPVTDPNGLRELYLEIHRWQRHTDPEKETEYIQFLTDIKAKYGIHPWQELSAESLRTLIYSS